MSKKHRGEGFQKRVRPEDAKPVRIAVATYQEDGSVACSCGGWTYFHPRNKIVENAIDRHFAKRHGGQGIRL